MIKTVLIYFAVVSGMPVNTAPVTFEDEASCRVALEGLSVATRAVQVQGDCYPLSAAPVVVATTPPPAIPATQAPRKSGGDPMCPQGCIMLTPGVGR